MTILQTLLYGLGDTPVSARDLHAMRRLAEDIDAVEPDDTEDVERMNRDANGLGEWDQL